MNASMGSSLVCTMLGERPLLAIEGWQARSSAANHRHAGSSTLSTYLDSPLPLMHTRARPSRARQLPASQPASQPLGNDTRRHGRSAALRAQSYVPHQRARASALLVIN